MSTTESEETEAKGTNGGAVAGVTADPLAGYNAARTALENERALLTDSRKRNEEERVRYRAKIDARLEEIHVALHGPRRTRKAKAST